MNLARDLLLGAAFLIALGGCAPPAGARAGSSPTPDCAATAPPAGPWTTFPGGLHMPDRVLWPGDALAFDRKGNLYTVTHGNLGWVYSFSPDGKEEVVYATVAPPLMRPSGVAVDQEGDVYTTDGSRNAIIKFGPDGNLRAVWGHRFLTFLSPVDRPTSPVVDRHDYLYVLSAARRQVVELNTAGHTLRSWGNPQLQEPRALTVDGQDDVYVIDHDSGNVLTFAPDGRLLASWPAIGPDRNVDNRSMGIAVDPKGRVYVSDGVASVLAFSPCGTLLRRWGGSIGAEPGIFDAPEGLAIDPAGTHLYVSDTGNHRIQVLNVAASAQ